MQGQQAVMARPSLQMGVHPSDKSKVPYDSLLCPRSCTQMHRKLKVLEFTRLSKIGITYNENQGMEEPEAILAAIPRLAPWYVACTYTNPLQADCALCPGCLCLSLIQPPLYARSI